MIPYSRQSIGEDDIRAVSKVLRSPYLTQGPEVAVFERALTRYTGAKHAVAMSNGTAALHAAYAVAGIGKGDEVIVPALTFAATANAVLYVGARPVFTDVHPDTGNIDIQDAARKITKRTKAIVAVDYAGLPADLDAVRRLARKHNLIFIEDAAQALGATYKRRRVGTIADMTVFSFHPVKSITTGEGGAVLTDNKAFFEKLVMFRTHGITRDPKKLKNKKRAAWHQEMQLLGYNYRLTDMQASLGTSQMKKLGRFIAERRAAAKRYFELFSKVDGVVLPSDSNLKNSAWHLFVVHVPPRIRDKVFTALRGVGIGAQVHYLPVYLHPYYAKLGHKRGKCPLAEAFSFSALSIPLFPGITKGQQTVVVRKLRSILKSHEV